MVEFEIDERELVIGEKTISFEAPIAETIDYGAFVVIRLQNNAETHEDWLQNVIAFEEDGSVRWRLPEIPEYKPRPYTNIFSNDEYELGVHNSSGNLYRVNPETGEILDREFVK